MTAARRAGRGSAANTEMPERSVIDAVDLFCGAGGTSTGLEMACKELKINLRLLAINHWQVAIDTHRQNHPAAEHRCESADNVDPRKAVPGGRLRIFVASPECTHHSNARGGRPMSDQSRASAWHVLRWAEALYIDNIVVENVKEFRSWGPLGANGRPIKRLRGQLYLQFLSSLRALGYKVEDRVLNCADYGDPTTRERLFIIARRNKPICWPQATHAAPEKLARQNGNRNLFTSKSQGLKPWVAAREVIDWTIPGKSIFSRKKPLAQKTLERILAGAVKFGWPEPYLVVLRNHMGARSLDEPLSTLTAGGNHVALAEPFLLPNEGIYRGNAPRSMDAPLNTVTAGRGAGALVEAEPFLITQGGPQGQGRNPNSIAEPLPTVLGANKRAIVEPQAMILPHPHGSSIGQPGDSIDKPLRTVTATSSDMMLVDPQAFILPHRMFDQGQPDSIERPLRTLVGKNARQMRVCEPVIIASDHHGANGLQARPVSQPLQTVTADGGFKLAEPFLLDINHGRKADELPEKEGQRRAHSVDRPLSTVTCNRGKGIVEAFAGHEEDAEPFLAKYNGTAEAVAVAEPLDTIPTKDRFALVTTGEGTFALDIRLRMLKVHELAAAHSVRGQTFTGKMEEQVKQIGNMVPAMTAKALCRAVLS